MKILLLFFNLLFVTLALNGQDNKIKFGKINPEDLAMTSFAADTEANAIILSDIGLIKYDPLAGGNNLVRFHHVVIKILNKRGIEEYGNVALSYYAYNQASYINNLKAMVHLPDGTEIKLKSDQFIDEEINDYYARKKIAFPSVTEGAILEYEYQLSSDDVFNPVDWFFQGDAPIRYAELIVKIPNWFDYVILTQGQALFQSSRTQESEPGGDVVYNKWTYIHKNMPALREEKYITTMEDYYSRIRFRLNTVQFPNQIRENILNSWSKVSETLWSIPAFGYQLNNKRPGELVLEAAGIMSGDTSQRFDQANQLYTYINTNIENTGRISIGTSLEIQEILKKRSASSGNLNKLMLAGLLQLGVEAYPVLISTREHGKPFELYPFIDQFNHMLIMAKLNGKETWIDLGNSKRPLGQLAARSLNTRGWVAAKENPYWTNLPQHESKSILIVKGNLTADGMFNGEVEGRFSGFHALEQRVDYTDDPEKYFTDYLTFSTSQVSVTDLEIINEKEIDKPFQMKGKINGLQLGDVGHNKIYLSQIGLEALMENPFRQEIREYPVEYNYGEDFTVILDMFLPENYTVESLPKSAKYTTEQNGMQVSLQTSSLSNKISLVSKFAIKQLVFTPEEYPALKNIYSLHTEMFSEQIVITKTP